MHQGSLLTADVIYLHGEPRGVLGYAVASVVWCQRAWDRRAREFLQRRIPNTLMSTPDYQLPEGQTIVFLVDESDSGRRLDHVLVNQVGSMSRSRLQALIRNRHVCIDSVVVDDPGHKVKADQSVEVTVPPPEPIDAEPQQISLDVIFEDDALIVIDKPAGLVVHPAPGHHSGTLVNALLAHCGASLSGIGGVRRPGIVHRLDKETSGLLVVAKTDAAHEGLSAQFKSHGRDGRLQRRYVALVWGMFDRPKGTISAAIGRSSSNRKKMAVVRDDVGREAIERGGTSIAVTTYASRGQHNTTTATCRSLSAGWSRLNWAK